MGPLSLWPAKPIWFGWRNIREELSGLWRSSRWTVQQLFWTGPRCWVCWEDWHHYNGTGYSIFHWAADARRDGDRWALPPGYVGSGMEDVSWGGYPTYSTAGNGSLYASPCGSLQLLFSSILGTDSKGVTGSGGLGGSYLWGTSSCRWQSSGLGTAEHLGQESKLCGCRRVWPGLHSTLPVTTEDGVSVTDSSGKTDPETAGVVSAREEGEGWRSWFSEHGSAVGWLIAMDTFGYDGAVAVDHSEQGDLVGAEYLGV